MTVSDPIRSRAWDWMAYAVGVLAASACVVVLSSLFIDRFGLVDELGLYNPVYVWLTTGKMTYPAHYYFDNMVVHPPVHYLAIGLWMKLGLSVYYAEAMPTLLMHLVALAAIFRSPFPSTVRAGLTIGLVAPILVLPNTQVEFFGTRPEGELNAAWIAGLVLLESARLRNWHRWQLLLGSALVTYASTLHYYAAFAWLGAAVYVVWALLAAGSHRRSAAFSIVVGGLIVGVPFTVGFLVPEYESIRFIVTSVQQAGAGPASPFDDHLAQYQWFRSVYPLGARAAFVVTGLSLVFVTGVPALFWLFGWAFWQSMRGVLVAALPLLLFLLFFAQRKHGAYYAHELTLASAFFCAVAFTTLGAISARVRRARLLAPLSVVAVGLTLPFLPPRVQGMSMGAQVHEMEVARAAALTIVGADALIAGRIGTWFISGARRWFGIDNYMYANTGVEDPPSFLERFDAFAESGHMSYIVGPNGEGLTQWFGQLKLWLRGFYMSRPSNRQVSYVLLVPRRAEAVQGYINVEGRVLRFDEHPGGTAIVVARCSSAAASVLSGQAQSSITLLLPSAPNASADSMVTAVMGAADPVPSGCSEFERRVGALTPTTERDLLEYGRRVDGPMQFYRDLSAVPQPNR